MSLKSAVIASRSGTINIQPVSASERRTPYTAMFGTEPKVGLTSSSIPAEIIQRLETEDDLLTALSVPLNSANDVPPPLPDDQLPASQCDDVPPPPPDNQLPSSLPPPLSPSPLGLRRRNIRNERKRARECLTDQAERMVKRSRIELQPGNIGDNVALPVPMVDRGRGDPRNILGVIIDKNENNLYTIATRHGILSNKYTRADFTLCRQQLLKDSDINRDKLVSLREALKLAVKDLSNVDVRPCRKNVVT